MQIPDYEGKIEKESILYLSWGPILKTRAHGRKGGRRHTRIQFSSIHLLSSVWLFATPWTAAHQASLSITNSWSLLKFMSIQSVIHPAISSSVVPFSSCLQSFLAPGSFPMSQFFAPGGQSIGIRYPQFTCIRRLEPGSLNL